MQCALFAAAALRHTVGENWASVKHEEAKPQDMV